MLTELTIENIAIIDRQTVEFAPGLNVLSGETGAGKSIVFAALGLILGGRASTEMVRTGTKGARVTGRFNLRRNPQVLALLREKGLPAQTELVIRRSVPARGSGRATINDKAVNLATLQELGRFLIDFSGQHEHQVLLNPDEHLAILDRYARCEPLRDQMFEAWSALSGARRELSKLKSLKSSAEQRSAFLRFQIKSLKRLKLRVGEEEDLEQEAGLLRHSARLRQGVTLAESNLYGEEGSAVERMDYAISLLQDLADVDERYSELAAEIEDARYRIEDTTRDLRTQAGSIPDDDPERLEVIDERLAAIDQLKREHGTDYEGLINKQDELVSELDSLENVDDRIADLQIKVVEYGEVAKAIAMDLRRVRHENATQLEKTVAEQLFGLGMPRARFLVDMQTLTEGERAGDIRICETGADRAELFLSANPGEEPRPMVKVASGGELSRIMLALKVSLHGASQVDTFVFDEVDTGMGGATGEIVGRKLKALSRRGQLLCITHLPQVAGLADAHFEVHKEVVEDRTHTQIQRLDKEGRVVELARMIGGEAMSDDSVRFARKLLKTYAQAS